MPKETTFQGPHVGAAFLCEKVLVEQGNVPTFVRVVDRFTVPVFSQPIPPGVPMLPNMVQASLVVMLKAGDIGAGRHTIIVKLEKPDGSYGFEQPATIFFQGSGENGAMLQMPIALAAPEEGLYWFELYFDEVKLLARVPMRILFQPAMFQVAPIGPAEG
jgi:hypothetical protein